MQLAELDLQNDQVDKRASRPRATAQIHDHRGGLGTFETTQVEDLTKSWSYAVHCEPDETEQIAGNGGDAKRWKRWRREEMDRQRPPGKQALSCSCGAAD